MSRFLRQSDPAWSKDTLGQGPSMIGRAGCLLTCLVTASGMKGRMLGVQEAHRILLDAGCFVGSALIWRKAAETLGLTAGGSVKDTEQGARGAVKACIQDAIARGGFVLVHVDHDAKRPGGDPEADHWILGYRLEAVDVYVAPGDVRRSWDLMCADPATGEEVAIHMGDLSGVSRWGSVPRDYTVREARCVF